MAGNSHLYANPIHYLGDIKVAGDSTPDRVSVSLGGLCSLVLTEPDAARQLLVAAVEALRLLDPDSPVQLAGDVTKGVAADDAQPGNIPGTSIPVPPGGATCGHCGFDGPLLVMGGTFRCINQVRCAERQAANLTASRER